MRCVRDAKRERSFRAPPAYTTWANRIVRRGTLDEAMTEGLSDSDLVKFAEELEANDSVFEATLQRLRGEIDAARYRPFSTPVPARCPDAVVEQLYAKLTEIVRHAEGNITDWSRLIRFGRAFFVTVVEAKRPDYPFVLDRDLRQLEAELGRYNSMMEHGGSRPDPMNKIRLCAQAQHRVHSLWSDMVTQMYQEWITLGETAGNSDDVEF